MMNKFTFLLIPFVCWSAPNHSYSQTCSLLFQTPQYEETKVVPFHMPGLEIASVSDPTLSTGATLFFFPKGAHANFDARGGSVAAVETTLLEEGSYSNLIDGIAFAGGSTMGLAAADGVRSRIFKDRIESSAF